MMSPMRRRRGVRRGEEKVAMEFSLIILQRHREVAYSRERMIHVLGLLGMERILGHRGDNTAASLPRALIPT